MLLLIDNYDSFVHNLSRYFSEMGCETIVVRNDAMTIDQIRMLAPAGIVISPGPCTPREAGISCEVVRQFSSSIPIFGVCLGHQAIAAALGGKIVRASEPVHGRTSPIHHCGTGLFTAIPSPFRATRYHSLVIDEVTLPRELVVTARTSDGVPMAIAHQDWPVCGVQFHPESVLTEHGRTLLANFLSLANIPYQLRPHTDWVEPVPLAYEKAGNPLVPWW